MKELINSFISNIHVIILIYGLYGAYEKYDEYSVQKESIVSQFTGIDQEVANIQKKVREIQDATKKTDEFRARVEAVAKNIESVQKQLPAEINDGQILTFFSQEMNVLNIKDPNIVPGKEETSTYFISKEYALKAKGTFLQFLIFLERIGSADRIYNIKELKLVSSESSKKGRFQLLDAVGLVQAYRFNPSFKVVRGFSEGTAQAGAP